MDLEIDTKEKDSGKFDAENVDSELTSAIEAEGTVGEKQLSPAGSLGLSPPPATKGRGLKKWRRIRRESGKDTNNNFDSNKKRGITITGLPVGMNQRSEGSSSSTNAMSNVLGSALNHISLYGDFGLGTGPDFASRADSETSEDQNSRSSTAASVPRGYHEFPVVDLGLNLIGMNSGTLGGRQEKDQNSTKKARAVKIKKQNSVSSMESESRSSNLVFMHGANSTTSNGRPNGRSGNHDKHDSGDDARDDDGHFNDASQTALSKESADFENVDDHVVETIMPLLMAQEALEREVHKLRDVGNDDCLSFNDSDPSKVVHLQTKLEEVLLMLELKNTKISKQESTLNFTKIENEYEEFLTRRIAAELEYVVISETIQNRKAGHGVNPKIQQEHMKVEDSLEKDGKKLKNRVWRYACCFVIQLVLFLVVLYIFVLQFSSKIMEVMPT